MEIRKEREKRAEKNTIKRGVERRKKRGEE